LLADKFPNKRLNVVRKLLFQSTWNNIKYGKNVNNSEAIHKALDTMEEEKFRAMYYESILDKSTRKILTLVVYKEGRKSFKLDVDCDIIYNNIDQFSMYLTSACY